MALLPLVVLERLAVVAAVLLLVVLPTAAHGWPVTLRGNLFVALVVAGGLALAGWRSRPGPSAVLSLGLFLAALAVGGGWFPDSGVALFSLAFAVLALGWTGRAAWLVAACGLAYLVPFYVLAQIDSWVAALMFTVPPFAAGTAFRLRRETGDLLTLRARELEESASSSGRSRCATSGRGSRASCTTSSATPSA